MKKNYHLLAVLLMCCTSIFAQTSLLENPAVTCGSFEMQEKYFARNPEARQAFCPLVAECYAPAGVDAAVEDFMFELLPP